jgi:hypothetical protein
MTINLITTPAHHEISVSTKYFHQRNADRNATPMEKCHQVGSIEQRGNDREIRFGLTSVVGVSVGDVAASDFGSQFNNLRSF